MEEGSLKIDRQMTKDEPFERQPVALNKLS
jgi:hypothetical protein